MLKYIHYTYINIKRSLKFSIIIIYFFSGPNIASMGLANSLDDVADPPSNNAAEEFDMSFADIDDEELESYIMNEDEIQYKNGLWLRMNADYLDQQKSKPAYFSIFD